MRGGWRGVSWWYLSQVTPPLPPLPYYGTSRPVPPPKPTPLGSTGSGGGVVGTVRVGLCTAASPLDTHTAKDDGRVCM